MLIEPENMNILLTQASILGIVVFCYALMLCYVFADTQHLGFSPWFWFILTLALNLAGFVIYLIYTGFETKNWKRATLPIAYMIEGIIIGVMVLVPLIYTEALPKAQLMGILMAPPPPPPPPPPPAAPVPQRIIRKVTVDDIMRAPTMIPKTIARIKDEPDETPQGAVGVVGGVPGGVPGGTLGGVLGGVIGGVLSSAVAPPPPPKAAAPRRIRVGGQVEAAKLIFQPKPEYPPLAKMARIQGTVRNDSGFEGHAGASLAGEVGLGSRAALALPAHAAERRAGGSHYRDRREFHFVRIVRQVRSKPEFEISRGGNKTSCSGKIS
jgi:protein TonB